MYIYRDKKTGRFAFKSTWKRSRAHGGSRYIRNRIPARARHPRGVPATVRPIARPIKHEKRIESREEYEEFFDTFMGEEDVESSPDYGEDEE